MIYNPAETCLTRAAREAGVPACIDVYPGCWHAFDMLAPFRKVSRRAAARFERAYRYAARHFFSYT